MATSYSKPRGRLLSSATVAQICRVVRCPTDGSPRGVYVALCGYRLHIIGVEGDINGALDDITLKHTYTPTLTEGQARIDGTP